MNQSFTNMKKEGTPFPWSYFYDPSSGDFYIAVETTNDELDEKMWIFSPHSLLRFRVAVARILGIRIAPSPGSGEPLRWEEKEIQIQFSQRKNILHLFQILDPRQTTLRLSILDFGKGTADSGTILRKVWYLKPHRVPLQRFHWVVFQLLLVAQHSPFPWFEIRET